ncbi:MAG: 3-dehydroquinate synthase, partial [Alphaproteobacteria bacterium]
GLINDAQFFEWLEQNGEKVCALDEDALSYAVETSVWAKTRIVQSDEREKGDRALLNLGHTFGHALEAAAKYDGRLLHGEAVAIGICMAFDLSSRMGLCPRPTFDRVERHFQEIGLPTRASFIQPELNISVDKLVEIMGHDKKVSDGKIKYILVREIGEAFISGDVPEQLVRDVLRDSLGSDRAGIRERWKSVFSSHSQ